ncbi:MAG TPA: tRNA pseudouridine(38-40) synthase TruA [Thermoanaerobaculia bacterium]
MRVLFTIQYLGTRYAGWQTQSNATGVQQVIEIALSTLCKQPMRIEGAGRTDSGVHARGQRAHADLPIQIRPRGLLLGLNDLLPADIRIVDVVPVADPFHARFDASSKTYVYQIWNDSVAEVFHALTYAHVASRLEMGRMRDAAKALVGRHDFKSFTVAEPEVSSTTRTIKSVSVESEGRKVWIRVTADGFLRHMVRRIAGSLIEIGRGKLPTDAMRDALEPAFAPARWTAPAHGLVLENVEYDASHRPGPPESADDKMTAEA